MRGRKPKPTAQKRLAGALRSNRRNDREPTLPPPAVEAVPLELADDVVASAEWRRLLPLLTKAQVVTEGDRGSLLALCQQWSRYLASNAKVAESGMVVKSQSGYPMPNPYIGIANKALSMCVKLWSELGLTPSARSRVTTAGSGLGATLPDDAFAEFDEPVRPM